MDTTLSALRVFLAVAETGSLQQAGKQVGRCPSAVSMTLKQLSEEIGGDLFVSDRKNQLTKLGLFLLDSAKSQILYHDRSMSAVQAFAQGKIGKLEMACVPSVASQLLPGVIREFIARWPSVELDIRDTDSRTIARAVEQGIVEIGVAGHPPENSEVEFQSLFEDRLVVVAPRDHWLSEQTPIALSALKDEQLIANGIVANLEFPEIRRLNQNSKLMVRNTVSLLALVQAKVGITILPQLSVPPQNSELIALPLQGDLFKREVGILQRHDVPLSTAAQTFIQLFQESVHPHLTTSGEYSLHAL